MAFTHKDREELERARRTVTELEAKERDAHAALRDALFGAGIGTGRLPDMAEVAQHADSIRDALAPFDSGVRCEDEAA